MKKAIFILILPMLLLLAGCSGGQEADKPRSEGGLAVAGTDDRTAGPVKGMVTMIDLGADRCVPCKMMAPILEELKAEYRGRAAILFLDVWKDPEPARRYGIQAIPTQIFFDKNGAEVFRHVGFLGKEDIVGRLKSLGVK